MTNLYCIPAYPRLEIEPIKPKYGLIAYPNPEEPPRHRCRFPAHYPKFLSGLVKFLGGKILKTNDLWRCSICGSVYMFREPFKNGVLPLSFNVKHCNCGLFASCQSKFGCFYWHECSIQEWKAAGSRE